MIEVRLSTSDALKVSFAVGVLWGMIIGAAIYALGAS